MFDLKKMIHGLHGITFRVRFPSRKNENRRTSIRASILEDHSDVIIPKTPCCEMIGGFIPHLLQWHMQCNNENSVPLINYVKSYYGDIPEFLIEEFELFSDTDYKCAEYFPYIYQKVFLHQLEEFRVNDEKSLNAELEKYDLTEK